MDPATKSERHVMISFANEDRNAMRRVWKELEDAGFDVWVSERNIQPGTDWEDAVRDAIANSLAVVLVATPHARASPPVKGELQVAADENIRVIPLWLEGGEWSATVPIGMITTQHIDCRADFDEGMARAILSLRNPSTGVPPEPRVGGVRRWTKRAVRRWKEVTFVAALAVALTIAWSARRPAVVEGDPRARPEVSASASGAQRTPPVLGDPPRSIIAIDKALAGRWQLTFSRALPGVAYTLKGRLLLPSGTGGMLYWESTGTPDIGVGEIGDALSMRAEDLEGVIASVTDSSVLDAAEGYANVKKAVERQRETLCRNRIRSAEANTNTHPSDFCDAVRRYCNVVKACADHGATPANRTTCANLGRSCR